MVFGGWGLGLGVGVRVGVGFGGGGQSPEQIRREREGERETAGKVCEEVHSGTLMVVMSDLLGDRQAPWTLGQSASLWPLPWCW